MACFCVGPLRLITRRAGAAVAGYPGEWNAIIGNWHIPIISEPQFSSD
jgi:hypothetical protein